MRKKEKAQGFSLLELLATILIVSIVIGITGYFVMNAMDSAKENAGVLALNSLKEGAKAYASENADDIVWQDEESSTNSFACIPIKTLVNKGYFLEEEISKLKNNTDYFVLTRNENYVIIKETLDSENKCGSNTKKVTIPTAAQYCLTPQYNSKEQQLTKNVDNEKFTFENITAKDAGNYKVTVTLKEDYVKEGYVWTDDTTEAKEIYCTIEKSKPDLKLTNDGEDGKTLGTTVVTLEISPSETDTSETISGTIELKSSNKDIATARVVGENPITTQKEVEIEIEKLATRKALTYITITLNPTDTKNYSSSSIIYTIGEIKEKQATIPTAEKFCKEIYYNGEYQELTSEPEEGYQFYQNKYKEVGTYEVIAKLKYGYIWTDSDNPKGEIRFNCSIKKIEMTATYNSGGTCSPNTKTVAYAFPYGEAPCTPTKTGYIFNNWYDEDNNKITSETIVNRKEDHTLTANWTPKTVTVTFIRNYNSTDNTSVKQTFTYDEANQKFNSGFTRTGYTALGWSTNRNATTASLNFTASVTNNWINTNSPNITLYAIWKINVCTITYSPNSGTFTTNSTDTVQKLNYGYTMNSSTGMRDAKGGYYSATRTGYHLDSSTAWKSNLGTVYDEDSNYSATDFCPNLKNGDQSVTLKANWQINVCTINFDPNGGTFTTNANNTVKTVKYNATVDNMWNASGGTYTATRSDEFTKIKTSAAWISSYQNKTYDQASSYEAIDLCPKLASGNQTVTLSVNWFKWRKKTYSSCKTGSNTCSGGYVCTAYETAYSDCVTAGGSAGYCPSGYTQVSCNYCSSNCCKTSSQYSYCTSQYYDSCKTGANTCAGGWYDWADATSCSSSSTVKCRRKFWNGTYEDV